MGAMKFRMFFTWFLVVFLLDLYTWQALKTIISNPRTREIIKYLHFTITAIFIGGLIAFITIPGLETNKDFRTYFFASFFIIYFSKLIVVLFLFIDDIIRFFRWIAGQASNSFSGDKNITGAGVETNKISRLKFLSQAGIILGGIPLVMLTKGLIKGAYDYQVHNIKLKLDNLPEAFKGFRILQISDIHSGSWNNKTKVEAGIEMINAQQADLVVFTGDLVNNQTDEVYPWIDTLKKIQSKMGVYSILGNHDYGDYRQWNNPEEKKQNMLDMYRVHKEMGWKLMRDEHVLLEKQGEKIGLIGVENWGAGTYWPKYGNLEKALEGMPQVPIKILLSHDPTHWDAKVRPNHPDINLTLSGHTHGFQFGIEWKNFRWSPSKYIFKQWADLYTETQQYLYVNRGFGFLGFPGRVGILPEITVIELT